MLDFVPFCFGWCGVKTKEKLDGVCEVSEGARPARTSRGTRVRTRCKGRRMPEDEVAKQMRKAMPHIVAAQVEKAKGGSLIHTKWLWDKAEKSLKRKSSAEAEAARDSLAELLVEQMGG